MAFIVKDRVRDTTTTTGTGAITLSGTAPLRYRAFASVCATSDTFPYAIVHQSVGVDEWEVGVGTLTASTTFARTTVIAGTNGTSAVVFSAGTKDVMMVYYGTPLALRTITGTAGQITVTAGDGVAGNPTIAFDASIIAPTTQSLTTGTGATYTTPAGAKWIEVFMIGGGGGGAGCSASAAIAGSAGGTSTFNAINAAGGSGGPASANTNAAGGAGGTGGTGTATRRQAGAPGGTSFALTGQAISGSGGSGYFGGGGLELANAGATAVGNSAAANSGAGGGGAINGAGPNAGGGGGSGEFVYLIITNPAATYTYTVGTSGAGGVSTTNGGAGGTGFIFVIEHYDF